MEAMYLALKNKTILLGLMVLLAASCKKNETQQTEKTYPTPYSLTIPKGFPQPVLYADNPLTEEGILLGKMLYGDSILSTNGRACISCHQPALSFSSPMYHSWNGFHYSVPPHINLAFKKAYNWDGSQGCLDTLAMGDFAPEFFNANYDGLVQKLKAHPIYPSLFNKAFGVIDLNQLSYTELKRDIAYSIGQYLRTKISSNSKFDQYRRKEVLLDNNEYEGYVIFFSEKGDCFHCHGEPLFSDQEYHNNGLGDTYIGYDQGRTMVTNKEEDLGKFYTPTLRNIEQTAPYMHDGRLKTLEEVVEFYNSGVKDEVHVDPLMTKTNGTKNLNLTPLEKMQLVAFLRTLTDKTYSTY